MLSIGKGPRQVDDDPFELLLECHERIRRFSQAAIRLAEQREAPWAARRGTGTAVIRYFHEALPLHAADEDESLAPLLLARGVDERVRTLLVELRDEHVRIDELLEQLKPTWRRWVEHEARTDDTEDEACLERSRELAALFERHLQREEEQLFPAARSLLADEDRAALATAMRQRRGAGSV